MTPAPSKPVASPTLLAVTCYTIWGLVPLFYLPIHAFGAGAFEIIAHRSVWAAIWALGLVLATKQWPQVAAAFRSPRLRWMLLLTSILVASNWGIYVWAVTNGHTVESALGYYLTPLLNMAAGSLVFRERIDAWGKGAIALAVLGVLIEIVAIGQVPWIAVMLALTFGSYGVLRKHLVVPALVGLCVECLYLFLPALGYLVWFEATGQGHFFHPAHAFLAVADRAGDSLAAGHVFLRGAAHSVVDHGLCAIHRPDPDLHHRPVGRRTVQRGQRRVVCLYLGGSDRLCVGRLEAAEGGEDRRGLA